MANSKILVVGMLVLASSVPPASAGAPIATTEVDAQREGRIEAPARLLAGLNPLTRIRKSNTSDPPGGKETAQTFVSKCARTVGVVAGAALGATVGFAYLGPAGGVISTTVGATVGQVIVDGRNQRLLLESMPQRAFPETCARSRPDP